MKILYIGQRGIPAVPGGKEAGDGLAERRVEALATALAANGHKVTVTCAKPYVTKNLRNFNSVRLKHNFSWHPDKSGGWVHDLFSLWTLWQTQPGVVHIHGWRVPALAPLAVVLSPESTYIWTVESRPQWPDWVVKVVAKQAAALFDVITTPTRKMQYQLLQDFRVRAAYIPDGYEVNSVPLLPLKHFSLTGRLYNVVAVATPQQLRLVARAYKQAGIRKKLVVLAEKAGGYKRMAKEFPFLHFVGDIKGRALRSVLAKAGMAILVGDEVSLEMILSAMDAGRAMVATTDMKYQETLGTGARYVKPRDLKGMATVLKDLAADPLRQSVLANKARKRAQAHFRWRRILPEYLEMYHYLVLRSVPIDSASSVKLRKASA